MKTYAGIYPIPIKRTVPYESIYRHEAMLALLKRIENPEEPFGYPIDALQATWTHPNGDVTVFSFITINPQWLKADEKKGPPKMFHRACMTPINLNTANDSHIEVVRDWQREAVNPQPALTRLLETLPDPER